MTRGEPASTRSRWLGHHQPRRSWHPVPPALPHGHASRPPEPHQRRRTAPGRRARQSTRAGRWARIHLTPTGTAWSRPSAHCEPATARTRTTGDGRRLVPQVAWACRDGRYATAGRARRPGPRHGRVAALRGERAPGRRRATRDAWPGGFSSRPPLPSTAPCAPAPWRAR